MSFLIRSTAPHPDFQIGVKESLSINPEHTPGSRPGSGMGWFLKPRHLVRESYGLVQSFFAQGAYLVAQQAEKKGLSSQDDDKSGKNRESPPASQGFKKAVSAAKEDEHDADPSEELDGFEKQEALKRSSRVANPSWIILTELLPIR